jgi:hypothetical protein
VLVAPQRSRGYHPPVFQWSPGSVYVPEYNIRRLYTCAKKMDKPVVVGFIPPFPQVNGGIAQLVERLVRNEKARGSNPLTSSVRFKARKVAGRL